MSRKTRSQNLPSRKTYNVRVYYCPNCGHIFHSLRTNLEKDRCKKCYIGDLSIIDKYKSKKIPRASGKRNNWLTKWGVYQPSETIKRILASEFGGE